MTQDQTATPGSPGQGGALPTSGGPLAITLYTRVGRGCVVAAGRTLAELEERTRRYQRDAVEDDLERQGWVEIPFTGEKGRRPELVDLVVEEHIREALAWPLVTVHGGPDGLRNLFHELQIEAEVEDLLLESEPDAWTPPAPEDQEDPIGRRARVREAVRTCPDQVLEVVEAFLYAERKPPAAPDLRRYTDADPPYVDDDPRTWELPTSRACCAAQELLRVGEELESDVGARRDVTSARVRVLELRELALDLLVALEEVAVDVGLVEDPPVRGVARDLVDLGEEVTGDLGEAPFVPGEPQLPHVPGLPWLLLPEHADEAEAERRSRMCHAMRRCPIGLLPVVEAFLAGLAPKAWTRPRRQADETPSERIARLAHAVKVCPPEVLAAVEATLYAGVR